MTRESGQAEAGPEDQESKIEKKIPIPIGSTTWYWKSLVVPSSSAHESWNEDSEYLLVQRLTDSKKMHF